MALLAAGVTRRYGRRWALRGADLGVRPGEVVGLEGHNGSGKSTLLRVFSTLVRATSGRATVFGRDVRNEADWVRGQVALMTYHPGLYDDLTAGENLRFAASMLGTGTSGIEAALDRVGLLREANERVRTFSSGMQRRLSLARLLMQRPRILLLDEPYNSLDRQGVALVNEVVAEVVRGRDDSAALIVMHDRQSAGTLLDRVEVMFQGRIEGQADPELPSPAELLAGLAS
jgi:heme ABC exporter ATP-binding subunit CcmA